ncbi:MAG: hypothetical protein C0432_00665 [Candidatus Puniceispirillum sp.]|nr:hypothetical protein [Candidatus Pelagibacter sp.]MBA4282795.1 hypothetical protein [Candidatus Puniceispirillum sp.]
MRLFTKKCKGFLMGSASIGAVLLFFSQNHVFQEEIFFHMMIQENKVKNKELFFSRKTLLIQ